MFYSVGQQIRPQTRVHYFVKSKSIYNFFAGRFTGKFAGKWLLRNPATPCICCQTTNLSLVACFLTLVLSQGRRVATYLRSGGVVYKQIKKGLLLCL